jgi:hypothetical protein
MRNWRGSAMMRDKGVRMSMMSLLAKGRPIYGYLIFSVLFCLLRPLGRGHMTAWVDIPLCALLQPDLVCFNYGLEIVFWGVWLALIVLCKKHRLRFVVVTFLLYSLYYNIAMFWIFGDDFCTIESHWFVIPLNFIFC